jgi:Tubulin-tyrosine ligase family
VQVPNINNGRGIEMLGGNSQKLQNVVERVRSELHHLAKNATLHNNFSSTDSRDEDDTNNSKWKRKMHNNYVIQAFICNELTWHGGKKFDLRMHWMIPSIDPLIVLFSDGFVRVGSSTYDEVDFSDTTRHLTTMTHLDGEAKGTMDEFKQLIYEHFNRNYRNLSKRFKGGPYQHVRKQMMEAIAETVAAFREVTFGNANVTLRPENAFSLYGADFVLDNNLDIWYLEPQGGPGFIEDYDFKVALHRDMLRSTFSMMIEIQEKLEKDPLANVLPLCTKYVEWDIVYAGNWLYQYKEYNRPPPSQACNTSPIRLPIHLNKSSQLRGLNAWRTRQRSSRPAIAD